MRRIVERIEQDLSKITGLLSRSTARLEFPQTKTTLSQYSYTRIAQICDEALALSRVSNVLGRDERVDFIYRKLNQQEQNPAPITAAVVIGLARAGNLEVQDVETLRDITFVLPVIDQRYRPFCDTIERSIKTTDRMARSSRPDYASSQQLAVIAKDSFDAFRKHKWERTRFIPYVTPGSERRVISSRKEFVSSLRGSDDIAGASVRIAVDLGVLTTQPQRLSPEEKEWLRRNIHYVRLVGNVRLNTTLENFNSSLRNQ